MTAAAAIVGVLFAFGALPAGATPSGPTANDKKCATLGQLVPAASGVASGNASSTRRQARVLNDIADGKHVPRKVKAALEKLAQWFSDARDRSLNERLLSLRLLRAQIITIVRYTVKTCGATTGTTTASTTAPLR